MYINILFIAIMLAAIVIIAKQEELTKAVRGFVISMLLLAVAIAVLFEYSNTKIDKDSRPTLNAFKLGKTLNCSGDDINQTIYSYEAGTSSFQPRINIVGETYAVQECSQK